MECHLALSRNRPGLAGLDDVLGAPDRTRGVEGQDLADDEPVEEHPERSEVLLDARRRERPGELLDVGRDHHGLELAQGEASVLAPLGEAAHGREVGEARVPVPEVGGEELPEAPLRVLGGGEERRRRRVASGRGRARGGLDGDQVGEHGSGNMGRECTPSLVVHKGRYVVSRIGARSVSHRATNPPIRLSQHATVRRATTRFPPFTNRTAGRLRSPPVPTTKRKTEVAHSSTPPSSGFCLHPG